MRNLLIVLLKCSISMSLVTLAYASVLPFLSKRYAAKWRYMVWLVIAVGWLFPFRPRIDLSFLPVQIPDVTVTPVQPNFNVRPITYAGDIIKAPSTIPLWWILTAIWISGVASVILYHALRHGRFMKIVRRWSEPVTDLKRLEILDNLKSELGIKISIRLSVCEGITSPMLVGFFQPVILLPDIKILDDELALILKHELIHLRRYDLWYKALILLATVFHWFNPVVYLMAKATAMQCEISCDALVLQDADLEQRKQYGETIIGVVRKGAKLQTALSTNFYGGKKGMKNRISSIMDTKQKKAGVVVLCMVLVGIVMTGATLATKDDSINNVRTITNNQIGQISMDGGQTWIDEKEYENMYPMSDVIWWTYDEYKEWLAEQKKILPNLIGETGGYYDEEGALHKEVWTQKMVDEAIVWYEQILETIKNGAKISKSVDGDESIGYALNPIGAPAVNYSTRFSSGNSKTKGLGSYATVEESFAVYKQYGLTYNKGTDQLFYNGKLVRYFEDYYPIGDNENNGYSGVDYFDENGRIDVHGVRDLSKTTHNSDGSFDPSGKLIGVEPYSKDEFDARDIEKLKNPPMQETLVYESSTADTSSMAQESQENKTTIYYSSEMILTPDELAKEYSVYEPFGLTYDKGKDSFYYNGELVRQFVDILASNGEALSGGKFKGNMRQLGSPDGEIEIKAVRDYTKLDAKGYGTLTGIEVVK